MVADLEAENRRLKHLNISLQTQNDDLFVKNETLVIDLQTLKGQNYPIKL